MFFNLNTETRRHRVIRLVRLKGTTTPPRLDADASGSAGVPPAACVESNLKNAVEIICFVGKPRAGRPRSQWLRVPNYTSRKECPRSQWLRIPTAQVGVLLCIFEHLKKFTSVSPCLCVYKKTSLFLRASVFIKVYKKNISVSPCLCVQI